MTTLTPNAENFLVATAPSLQCCADGAYWRIQFRNAETKKVIGPGAATASKNLNGRRWEFGFTLGPADDFPNGVFNIPQGYHYAEVFNTPTPDEALPARACFTDVVYLPITDKRTGPAGPFDFITQS